MAEDDTVVQPDWLGMVRAAVTPALWQAIIEAQAVKALKGDPKALDFFASCCLPTEKERGAATGDAKVKEIRFVLAVKPDENASDGS